ncbi:MAG TPA: 4Fe-4S double cluster binding domain-containing protein [Anaerolineae bacterium]|nr:4Fe-4S double cluster binding domain-containing protein [Anaerolineae bacterium]
MPDLREEFEGRRNQGVFDQELYESYLAEFTFSPPASLPGARSIIIVAVPQPQIRVAFNWDGETVPSIIPPTYPERRLDARVQELLRQLLEPAGYRVAHAALPRKLLAVRSGLAAYGKNNITYVPGMGSFHGLVAVYSDLPAHSDGWRESQMMEACQSCSACHRRCPAGAIAADRFLLHAERCLTFHNEKPADVPFAGWIEPSWHNCLIGCLECQTVCPENRQVRQWFEEGAEFSQEETALLLEGVPLGQMPASTVEKMERLGLDGYAGRLPRNLNALLHQRR